MATETNSSNWYNLSDIAIASQLGRFITIVQVLRALEHLHLFDTWKATETDHKLMRAQMPDKKDVLASSQIKHEHKREENEWEWL